MKNDYQVIGDMTKIFVKSKGKTYEFLIDTTDLEKVHDNYPNTWTLAVRKGNHYAVGQSKGKYFYLHRYLLGAGKGDVVDHINHNTFDNRKSENLRIVDISGNNQNLKGARKNNKTGIRGVHFFKRTNQYTANVGMDGKTKHLGYFNSAEEAGKAAEKARVELGYLSIGGEVNAIYSRGRI